MSHCCNGLDKDMNIREVLGFNARLKNFSLLIKTSVPCSVKTYSFILHAQV